MTSRTASVLLLFNAFVLTAHAAQPVEYYDPTRGRVPLTEEPRPAPIPAVENRDVKRERDWPMQPPTIPHKVEGYQIDRFANKCMSCHSRARAEENQAPAISITHYLDREGNFLAVLSPRRYFCDQCHVPQTEVKPVVESTFKDIDELLREAKRAKKLPAKK